MNYFSSLKEYEGMKPGLSRIKKFLKLCASPHDKIQCVHIAGTNAKGSVAAIISSALRSSGYKTALYISPHLLDITERISVNGKNISKRAFNRLSGKYYNLAKKCRLSYFEYITAIAFIYFALEKVDIAVIETGLGGRFDATNVIKNPLACIITSIGFDHREILGRSLSQIAFEKAGIIKKGSPVICGKMPQAALKVIEQKSAPFVFGKQFKISRAQYDKIKNIQSFDYSGTRIKLEDVKISLLGEHQLQNAAVALCALELMPEKNFVFDEKRVKNGLRKAFLPARLDLRKTPSGAQLLIDGAHNAQAIETFVSFYKKYCGAKKRAFIFAAMKEKDYKRILRALAPFANRFIFPTLANDRAVSPVILEREVLKLNAKVKTVKNVSVKEALSTIKSGEKAAAAGSLYLAGEILKTIDK
ncbi:MAG: bifunctional folylpolyglutamate synthase/dihydrofolate synthase [Endomicrobium sp.]|jgi:dihydrofolate synthase/folylpolyglutamate synthase|nr:bifunctional folylpolyglutamate synthase/dihydrofolate synthase [Endomicrobium sp.]